jgi:hypothetical protein
MHKCVCACVCVCVCGCVCVCMYCCAVDFSELELKVSPLTRLPPYTTCSAPELVLALFALPLLEIFDDLHCRPHDSNVVSDELGRVSQQFLQVELCHTRCPIFALVEMPCDMWLYMGMYMFLHTR